MSINQAADKQINTMRAAGGLTAAADQTSALTETRGPRQIGFESLVSAGRARLAFNKRKHVCQTSPERDERRLALD